MRGYVLENEKEKLVWDFELSLPKTATSRRPDLLFEGKEKIKIWV